MRSPCADPKCTRPNACNRIALAKRRMLAHDRKRPGKRRASRSFMNFAPWTHAVHLHYFVRALAGLCFSVKRSIAREQTATPRRRQANSLRFSCPLAALTITIRAMADDAMRTHRPRPRSVALAIDARRFNRALAIAGDRNLALALILKRRPKTRIPIIAAARTSRSRECRSHDALGGGHDRLSYDASPAVLSERILQPAYPSRHQAEWAEGSRAQLNDSYPRFRARDTT